MPKPLGGVSSTFVVARPSFSVGTASVKSSAVFVCATGGLISAWAHALEAKARPEAATAAPASARTRTQLGFIFVLSFRRRSRGALPRQASGEPGRTAGAERRREPGCKRRFAERRPREERNPVESHGPRNRGE